MTSAAKPTRGRLGLLVSVSFTTMLVLLGGIALLSVRNTMVMERAIAWVDSSHDVIEQLTELELDVREAEAALHIYILTGDAAWGAEYRKQAFDELQAHAREVRRLTGDRPGQRRRLDQIDPLLAQRVAIFEELRHAYETAPKDAGRQSVLLQSGAAVTQQIVALIEEFVAREEDLLATRTAEREADAHFVLVNIVAGGTLAVSCVGGALFMIFRGLRAERQAQKQLKVSLGEKEILLKEVHHRVKNNLQVVSSLLSLQAEKLRDPGSVAVFKECRDRIHSMARLHQQIYTNGQFAHVEFGSHLREMVEMLVQSHMPLQAEVTPVVHVAAVDIDLDTAITLGLIANELILNSLKHAFTGRARGTLTVELRAGTHHEMTVRDDGIGLPAGFDAKKNAGLGLDLMRGLTRQIHGEVRVENQPGRGLATTILFPLNETSLGSI